MLDRLVPRGLAAATIAVAGCDTLIFGVTTSPILALVAGCPGGPSMMMPPRPETPALTPFDPDTLVRATLDEVTVRTEARYADGSLAGGGTFTWAVSRVGAMDAEPGFAESGDGSGASEIVIEAPGRAGSLQVIVRYRLCGDPSDGASCVDAEPRTLLVHYLQREADEIIPPTDAISLGVGERRPYQPYTTAPGPGAANLIGALLESVTYETADPAIASVDARGLLVGEGVGETTLTMRSGDASAEVPITVIDTALGPPPEGRVTLITGAIDATSQIVHQHGLDGRLDVDARGWPAYLISSGIARSTYRPPLYLARWTGTGFGYEAVSPPHERTHRSRLVLDDAGNVYVTYTDEVVPRLATRAAEAPLEWTVRDFPHPPGERATVQREPSPGVLAREGGAWIAHAMMLDEPTEEDCEYFVRLARITLDADTYEDLCVEDPELFWQPPAGDPVLRQAYPPISVQLAGYDGDSRGRPQIVLTGTRVGDDSLTFAHLIRPTPGGFEMRKIAPQIYPPTGEIDVHQGAWTFQLPASAPGITPWMAWGGEGRGIYTATLEDLWDEVPASPELGFQAPVRFDNPIGGGAGSTVFALDVGAQRYFGMVGVGPIFRQTRDGNVLTDDPNSALHPEREVFDDPVVTDSRALAARGRDGRAHFVWQRNEDRVMSQLYGVITPPVPSRTDTPEAQGMRIHANDYSPRPLLPMLVLADGSRLLSTERAGSSPVSPPIEPDPCVLGIMRSPGPGMPFVGEGCSVVDYTWWAEHEGVIYALDGLDLHRSDDGGRTFRPYFTPPGWNAIDELVVDHQGTLWLSGRVTGADGRAGFVAHLATSTAFEELDFAGTPLAGVRPSHLRVFGDSLYVSNLGMSTRLAVFDLSGNFLRGSTLARTTTGDLLTHTLHATETGWMFLGHNGSRGDDQHFVVLLDREYTTEEVVPIGDTTWQSSPLPELTVPPVTLPDGRLAFAHRRWLGVEQEQAFLVTSADGGRTWTEPRALLPSTAGYGQSVWSLGLAGDGALYALVGDNESMRSWDQWPWDMLAGVPPHTYRVVRLEAP